MRRNIIQALQQWQHKKNRNPLILRGARQVGKTYILNIFGASSYKNIAYFNFESSPHLHSLFSGSLKPDDIIKILSVELSAPIVPVDTLIILDEIQACPNALNSLKYFNELAPNYHICAAGSLLGVTLAASKGFPVGKVDFLTLYPLSFEEFLEAINQDSLVQYLKNITAIEPLPGILHEKLLVYFKEYLYIGGMPAAILEYRESKNVNRVRDVQQNILDAYRLDSSKHAPPHSVMRINQIWDVIPSQLAKENKKFVYSIIRQGARSQEFEIAIQWLSDAGLVYKTYNTSTPKLPLNAYINHTIFKLYLFDVGLLGAMTHLSAKTIIHGNILFQEFRGALTENYVAQVLAHQGDDLFYWTSAGQAELDFILHYDDAIYPIEVKSGDSQKKKSLSAYIKKYEPTLAIRTSPMNLKLDGHILNCPLYLLGHLKRLLDIPKAFEYMH